jgi:hypothetical protein
MNVSETPQADNDRFHIRTLSDGPSSGSCILNVLSITFSLSTSLYARGVARDGTEPKEVARPEEPKATDFYRFDL